MCDGSSLAAKFMGEKGWLCRGPSEAQALESTSQHSKELPDKQQPVPAADRASQQSDGAANLMRLLQGLQQNQRMQQQLSD